MSLARTLSTGASAKQRSRLHCDAPRDDAACLEVVQVVMAMRRVDVIVLRWGGLRAYNVAASFPSLALATAAIRSLERFPISVSALVCSCAARDGHRLVPVVGAHSNDSDIRGQVARELTVHGGRGVTIFGDGDQPCCRS